MEIKIIGRSVILSTVSVSDAEFIANLRSDPDNYRFLSSSQSISIKEQKEWIVLNNKIKNGVYFIINNKKTNKNTGTVSIYNLDYNYHTAEFGRYMCVDPLNAIEAELLILEFSFNIMLLDSLYCRTAIDNYKVWKQHTIFGFVDLGIEKNIVKNMSLKKQSISREIFQQFDYSSIHNIIERLSK